MPYIPIISHGMCLPELAAYRNELAPTVAQAIRDGNSDPECDLSYITTGFIANALAAAHVQWLTDGQPLEDFPKQHTAAWSNAKAGGNAE